jgi:hypothetical protein
VLAPHKHVHGSSRQAAELTRGACLCRTLSTLTLDVDLRGRYTGVAVVRRCSDRIRHMDTRQPHGGNQPATGIPQRSTH